MSLVTALTCTTRQAVSARRAIQLQLASGSLLTGHADFVNSWDQEKLEDEVELCIGRDVVCGVTSG
jgi:hypothetical protein